MGSGVSSYNIMPSLSLMVLEYLSMLKSISKKKSVFFLIYTERKKKRIFTLVVICIKDVLIV